MASLDEEKEPKKTRRRTLLEAGAEIVGGGVGAGIGLFGGPVGAVAGGVAGVAVGKVLVSAVDEFSERVLGAGERVRVSAVLQLAAREIEERLQRGELPRQDGFLNDRLKSGEVIEAVLLAAQRSPEKKKLVHTAHLISNIAFDQSISSANAHQLIRASDALSFQQFCLLQIAKDVSKYNLRTHVHRDNDEQNLYNNRVKYQIYVDIWDLISKSYISNGSNAALDLSDIMPGQMFLVALGEDLHQGLCLDRIESADLEEVAQHLRK